MTTTDLGNAAATFDLEAQLEHLSLDSDVYKGYIEGIMDDEDGGDIEERVESVLTFLGGATEEDLGVFGTELKKQYEIRHAAEAARAASVVDAGKAEERRRYEERLEEDKKAAQAEQERQAAELIERTQGDRATARGREALLNKYAFGDDVVDEDGNPVGKPCGGKDGGEGAGEADVVLGALLGENSNKKQVEAAARALREKSKAEHEKKVVREKVRVGVMDGGADTHIVVVSLLLRVSFDFSLTHILLSASSRLPPLQELLIKDKMKKEAEKKRTQKKEKQRGCG